MVAIPCPSNGAYLVPRSPVRASTRIGLFLAVVAWRCCLWAPSLAARWFDAVRGRSCSGLRSRRLGFVWSQSAIAVARRDAYNPLNPYQCIPDEVLLDTSAELWLMSIRSRSFKGTRRRPLTFGSLFWLEKSAAQNAESDYS